MKPKKLTNTKLTVQKIVNEEARNYLRNIRQEIRKYLQNATLSLLGLESRWNNHYEVDHCNGRNSVLIDAFRNIATAEAEKLAKTYKPSKEDVASFQEAFKREFTYQIKYALSDLAKKKAQEEATKILEGIKLDVEAALAPAPQKEKTN